MPEADTADRAASAESAHVDVPDPEGLDPSDDTTLAAESSSPGWEAYLSATADELMPENPAGTGWYRTGIMSAVTGLLFPLFFGPAAVLLGLVAREKHHPRALVPIVMGILVTLYGAIYYWMAVSGRPG